LCVCTAEQSYVVLLAQRLEADGAYAVYVQSKQTLLPVLLV